MNIIIMENTLPTQLWSFCVFPFFDGRDYAVCLAVSSTMNKNVKESVSHRKCMVLSGKWTADRATVKIFAKYSHSLRVIDLRPAGQVWLKGLTKLVQNAPHLEAFLSCRADDPVLKVLIKECPHLTALALCTGEFSLETLFRFQPLKALELGCPNSDIHYSASKINQLLSYHPNIVILHLLAVQNTLTTIAPLRLAALCSLSCPYDREIITSAAISTLKNCPLLKNLNLGNSIIGENVVAETAKTGPNLKRFSLTPRRHLKNALHQFANDAQFQCLETLGCRTPKRRRRAFGHLGRQRRWTIVDYSAENTVFPAGHWCQLPFDFLTLLKDYDLLSGGCYE